MPSAEPTRLTDDLWLAAHDGVKGARLIGDWPLGVALATGLLAEFIQGGFLELREGELFRTAKAAAALPSDPALRPVLVTMQAEEQTWPVPTAPVRAWAHDEHSGWLPPVRQETRHRLPGHQLNAWISYLAYEQRAETRVLDRLSRTGLVRREEHRRLFGGTTVRYVPCDSYASGTPANTITHAVQTGRRLSGSDVVLAGLFLASGLHHHALATLSPYERSLLAQQIQAGLTDTGEPGIKAMVRELLQAADAAIGEAAMR
ncbi:GOLPH3/VPS74 family protein [Actinoplanes auranticolor]|uniref:Golgi phosphoprotein 3 GPP34 n=1 Tax=Actinoplanes auranticolor TaxID=47988 RepID=A0A919VLY4_9ACTN|nr:GPP34 family phosphoprotein [Actinoplanes auranticolor]GIM71094.1 hypothetical protein Aau02nite_44090 [Actinoplanes auranticolor]